MFSKRVSLHRARKYTREFFEKLVADLRLAGLEEVLILLPHNLVGMDSARITVDELLKRERNYVALILLAQNPSSHDTVKVLFVNRNSRAVFVDDTYPNAESEPPQLYVQSRDPVRCFGLSGFFKEYLERPPLFGHALALFAAFASLAIVIGETIYFGRNWTSAMASEMRPFLLLHIAAFVTAIVLLFRFFGRPTGLWIKPNRELKLFYLANMAVKGEFKDNPLVTVIVTVIGTIVTVLILKLLGLS